MSSDLKLLWYEKVSSMIMILGLDIGGANTKAASSDGSFTKSVYLPLWRSAPLVETLKGFACLNPTAVGVVITGELADCYTNKLEGVSHIKTAVESSFGCKAHFWGTSGFGWSDPLQLAGANWSASAALIAREIGDCIFVDMGSTTTDLIPIKKRPIAATTDFQRLARGELVYMGMLRTSAGALLRAAEVEGCLVPLSPELFAATADAYLALGDISPEKYTCDTPDGAGKDRPSSLRRLARTVCADLDEIGESGAMAVARQIKEHQFRLLVRALDRQSRAHDLNFVVAAGIGEDIIVRAAALLGMSYSRLSNRYRQVVSDVFPAYAVARLLDESLA
jgi:(4-(4-[2-(gamma-L-glutamylamino)ethyl]phenoxymethyl)furan-2-yl)methanamine synthase